MVKDYYEVRAIFKKTDRAIYISHLDLMRVMQRTFKRAKLPVWFTKGFNPHAYINFSLPLSLGVSSECEVMDFAVDMSSGLPDYEHLTVEMNKALPQGLEIVKMYAPVKSHTVIGSCDYTLKFMTDTPAEEVESAFVAFLSQPEILVEKRAKVNMKKTLVTVDIKPDIEVKGKRAGEYFEVDLHLPAGIKHTLNVVAVSTAFETYFGKEFDKICLKRTKIYDADGIDFI